MDLTLLEALRVTAEEVKEYADGLNAEVNATLNVHETSIAAKANTKQDISNAGKVWTVAQDGSLTFSDGGSGGSVDVDTTLTIAGKAADSKAVGDALAAISSVELDNTLSVNGKAADAKAVGDALFEKVSFTEDQTLTDIQKEQARKNINAASIKPKMRSVDFTSWDNGVFSVLLSDDTVSNFSVEFDSNTKAPVSITDSDGNSIQIVW